MKGKCLQREIKPITDLKEMVVIAYYLSHWINYWMSDTVSVMANWFKPWNQMLYGVETTSNDSKECFRRTKSETNFNKS